MADAMIKEKITVVNGSKCEIKKVVCTHFMEGKKKSELIISPIAPGKSGLCLLQVCQKSYFTVVATFVSKGKENESRPFQANLDTGNPITPVTLTFDVIADAFGTWKSVVWDGPK
jgi:hypothetical protein